VFVVATANDVTKLPPELLRRGRFDEIFFVDLPTQEERRDIIQLYLRRYLLKQPSPETFEKLVALSEGFAGSDLESAVREVALQAVSHGDNVIDDDLYMRCFNNIVPLSKTAPEQIESIRLWGRERAIHASGAVWSQTEIEKPTGKRTILV